MQKLQNTHILLFGVGGVGGYVLEALVRAGVGKITVPRRTRLYSSYELSLRDIDEGRVYEYESLDDLIKEIEG